MTNEQRHFTRIPFDASVTLSHSQTKQTFTTQLVDISFKGVLLKKPTGWQDENSEPYSLCLQLAGHEIEVNLDVIAVHTEEKYIGFKIEHMDIESATHLRRIVELNLGDEKLLERELHELIQS